METKDIEKSGYEEGGRMLVNPHIERGIAILAIAYQIEQLLTLFLREA
ncbi:MAG: hypothetical protein IBX41_04695 [Methanophagales archaeon]|nr:hypothetical protein [Methanophagales archaeon]